MVPTQVGAFGGSMVAGCLGCQGGGVPHLPFGRAGAGQRVILLATQPSVKGVGGHQVQVPTTHQVQQPTRPWWVVGPGHRPTVEFLSILVIYISTIVDGVNSVIANFVPIAVVNFAAAYSCLSLFLLSLSVVAVVVATVHSCQLTVVHVTVPLSVL